MNQIVGVHNGSPAQSKIALFRSLFRGREDVYPRRFESLRTGKSGYAPACANEWRPGVCEKPRIKCAVCPNRRFLPVTDEVIRWHLTGADDAGASFTMGVYPMLLDETCHLLAVDFDGETWGDDASAYLSTCTRQGVPAALERSRSGNGGHVWLFFDTAVAAGLARRLGALLLTETMDGRPDLGFRSYDRFFPSQDTLPHGGFGNLIALPLQGQPRKSGNSVFVDIDLIPFPDQWAHLSQLGRVSASVAESLMREAEKDGRVLGVKAVESDELLASAPWKAPPSRRPRAPPVTGPLPDAVEIVLGDGIYIAKQGIPPGIITRLMRLAAFQNPEFYRAQAMRLPTWGTPRIVGYVEDGPKFIRLPRGCLDDARHLLQRFGVKPSINDQRFLGVPLSVSFRGVLRPEQQMAASAMLAQDAGILAATTAFGKTVVAAWLIAQRGVNALILVHRKQLMEQWTARLCEFLDVEEREIGRLGGGRKKLRGRIDIAMIQSLIRNGEVDDRIADYGHVIMDECHHVPAPGFAQVADRAKARYVTGLSATVTRKDGQHPTLFMQCGPIRHRVDARRQAARRPFSHQVLVRPTGFRMPGEPDRDPRIEYRRICEHLTRDDARNTAICSDVGRSVRADRAPLVLTERIDHLEALAGGLRAIGASVVVLRGGMGTKPLRAALARADEHAPGQVLLATGRFIGEGFDNARLDTLFLTMPVSWRGTIAQYVGRLHRLHEHKREVRVYDYADFDVPMLTRMFDKRRRGYEAVGYSVSLPASAAPGWPAGIPLPADGSWKHRHGASLRRLLRDGVDEPLADLFTQVTPEIPSDAQGAERVRSGRGARARHSCFDACKACPRRATGFA
ncbi:MAG: DEAD/DEAH box helicase family protein [Chromatiales bacterium]|nr:DEAD/DEAH box helicase family protein [Chromatiales bacterium]